MEACVAAGHRASPRNLEEFCGARAFVSMMLASPASRGERRDQLWRLPLLPPASGSGYGTVRWR
jgi:hypothetical protein